MTIIESLRRFDLLGLVSVRGGASIALRLLLALAALSAVLFSSVTLYGIFYKLYVPQLLHEAPVYLQYPHLTTDSATVAVNTTALINFVPESNYKFLSTSQPYTVLLELDVPSSVANQELGNFMVYLEFRTRSGRVVQQSARPAILPYRSYVVRLMQIAIRAVPLALGLSKESDVLRIELMDVLYDRRFSPITNAHIALSKPLQVYSARIVIRAQFSGLRYWMYYWRLPTATIFISAAVMWQLLFTAGAWSVLESYTGRAFRRSLRTQSDPSAAAVAFDNSEVANLESTQDKNAKKQGKRRRSQNLHRKFTEGAERSVPDIRKSLSISNDDDYVGDDALYQSSNVPELEHSPIG
ncbi:putative adipose-regulatory protein-domain-containing protein [Coemansia spiralis]|nr:putative adipose-regulatory protein-domain-containing protein [Coemansia spiralis]